MSDMLPLATYSLNVEPYSPTPALNFEMPVTIRITMAAIDPEPFDDDKKPSTLRIIKRNPEHGDCCNHDNDDGHEENEEDSEEEVEAPKKSVKSKKGKGSEESESEDSEDENEMDDEFEECVLLTLSPKGQFQQALDITIAPEEDVQFVVTGSYTISLTGNYVKHPFDTPLEDNSSDSDSDEDEDDYGEESSDGEEEEDEEELSSGDDDLDDLVDASDIDSRLDELVKKDEKKKTNKKESKREREEDAEDAVQPAEVKQTAKKVKKTESGKESEEDKSKPKPKTKLLEGGIIIEDRLTGKGPHAKKGARVGMRYVGKLKNGKVFDKNTKGKPFVFKLGQGEVIKGWDIGVAGMAVGGERRIIIPAPYAYGKQALPGIPANSELTFDVKLVSMK
ncbi:hypothetical protein SMKI_12G4940 [Saccharomyces mikatae IFO 1815]|uniref:FK506-binding protein n=1 Tax=Saccharomyces mikatae IFO 1815 TaxID=226126 RepID=A0AA35NDZ5_SACMI|nr:uncharacterized protein SMKI_12G4940 [Saccharomyces mikatae IFO 1815]CAI4035341.1 hypothetical protein SMKI_12G4940 [Saccharomyces mikatae IFO 1815]